VAIFRLDFRPVFRARAKAELRRYADRLKSYQPAGAGLWAQVAALKPTIKSWGYILPLYKIGQKLTFFVRGTKHQPARPVEAEPDEDGLVREVEASAAAQISRWDREAS
jgi:hypothetical protein